MLSDLVYQTIQVSCFSPLGSHGVPFAGTMALPGANLGLRALRRDNEIADAQADGSQFVGRIL